MSVDTPALLEVRNALKKYLEDLSPGENILVGCSGGADSLALTYALHLESSKYSYLREDP